MTLPNKFDDLEAEELYRSAVEDFALDVSESEKDVKSILLAAFLEGGVSWDDYVAQHPEIAPEPIEEPAREAEVNRGGVLTSETIAPVSHAALSVEGEPVVVRVQEEPKYRANEKLLIKMERKNPLFETRGYKFTDTHPYQLMNPQDADWVMRNEDGFRQALPSELQEFYG